MQLGNNIQTLRKKKGLSQEKLAEKINVTRQTISNWELGETAPNPEQLILLSKQFDISIDELVGNDAMSSGSSRENKSIKDIYIGLIVLCGIVACRRKNQCYKADDIKLGIRRDCAEPGAINSLIKAIRHKH
jgi:transcriptional regulator with XRE-family HTH domain